MYSNTLVSVPLTELGWNALLTWRDVEECHIVERLARSLVATVGFSAFGVLALVEAVARSVFTGLAFVVACIPIGSQHKWSFVNACADSVENSAIISVVSFISLAWNLACFGTTMDLDD